MKQDWNPKNDKWIVILGLLAPFFALPFAVVMLFVGIGCLIDDVIIKPVNKCGKHHKGQWVLKGSVERFYSTFQTGYVQEAYCPICKRDRWDYKYVYDYPAP